MDISCEKLARMIDISAVRADATMAEIEEMINAAIKYKFICVFAMPCYTKIVSDKLSVYEDIFTGGVIGFPSGADTTNIKVAQTEEMLHAGADELDMVINIGAMKSGEYKIVSEDISAVVKSGLGKPVKAIIEAAYLNDYEISKASDIAVKAGVKYIKTGTGWAGKPTEIRTIEIIKSTIGDCAKIKAAGGIRNLDTIFKMIDAGCSRFGIGVNTALEIMQEAKHLNKDID